MNNYPHEFFLGNIFPIEKTRQQKKFSLCWAYSISSTLGDTFAIQNNLKPIYLSIPYIASMANDSCNYINEITEQKKDCNYTLKTGYITFDLAWFLKDKNIGVKLDKCFPTDSTISYLLDNGYEKYKNKQSKQKNNPPLTKKEWDTGDYYVLENINNICANGCLGKDKNCIKQNNLLQNFGIKISDIIDVHNYSISDKKETYTRIMIKNIQNNMKNMLFNHKKPIFSTIRFTEECIKFFTSGKNYLSPSIRLTEQKSYDHGVVILGWEKKDSKDYWIVRDSNFSDRFLKIEFSKNNNKDYWIGLDIKWEVKSVGTLFSLIIEGDFGGNTLNEYLDEKILEKVESNIYHEL